MCVLIFGLLAFIVFEPSQVSAYQHGRRTCDEVAASYALYISKQLDPTLATHLTQDFVHYIMDHRACRHSRLVIQEFTNLLSHPEYDVRGFAAAGLYHIGRAAKSAVPALQSALIQAHKDECALIESQPGPVVFWSGPSLSGDIQSALLAITGKAEPGFGLDSCDVR